MRLTRVGIEECAGCVPGGVDAYSRAGLALATLAQISVRDLRDKMNRMQVLDVRREAEWQAGHIEDALWWPLDRFSSELPQLERETPIAVHCKSGYRSAIASSLLLRAGYQNVTNIVGGFDAWCEAGLPSVST